MVKKFVQHNYPNEYTNHELYNDWNRCSITVGKVSNWLQNVKATGRVNLPIANSKSNSIRYQTKKLAENLLIAKIEIDKIKKDCKNKLEMASKLTSRKLAAKMGIHFTTANKYLNILEKNEY